MIDSPFQGFVGTLPVATIVLTNVAIISLAFILAIVGKKYYAFHIYYDDDIRFMSDMMNKAFQMNTNYTYICRVYLTNCTSLDSGYRGNKGIFFIEFLNSDMQHVTKVELDSEMMRQCFCRKIKCSELAEHKGDLEESTQVDLKSTQKNDTLYLVKFCFQRTMLLANVCYFRLRQTKEGMRKILKTF